MFRVDFVQASNVTWYMYDAYMIHIWCIHDAFRIRLWEVSSWQLKLCDVSLQENLEQQLGIYGTKNICGFKIALEVRTSMELFIYYKKVWSLWGSREGPSISINSLPTMKTGWIYGRLTSTASTKSICLMNLELCELTGTLPDAIFTPNVAKLFVIISDIE